MTSQAACPSLTPAHLARLLSVDRTTVDLWITRQLVAAYCLPGTRARRIEGRVALDFAQQHGQPLRGLQKWAERHGLTTARAPELLLVSEDLILPHAAREAGFLVTLAPSSRECWFAFDRSRFDCVLLDGQLGPGILEELRLWLPRESPETLLAFLAPEDAIGDAEQWERWGLQVVYRRPFDADKVATDLRSKYEKATKNHR